MKKSVLYLLINLHFPLWIIKDSSWFFSLTLDGHPIFKFISIAFAFITLVISGILVKNSEHKMNFLENFVLTIWLAANTSWMLHELFEIDFAATLAIGFFGFGILCIPLYVKEIIKDFRAKNSFNSPK